MPKSESGARIADPVYQSSWKTLCVLVHFISAIQNWYAIYYDYSYVHFSPSTEALDAHEAEIYNRNFGGKFRFLTFLNAVRNNTCSYIWHYLYYFITIVLLLTILIICRFCKQFILLFRCGMILLVPIE